MVSTQDVSFGMMWARLVGPEAHWAPGTDDVPALSAPEGRDEIGMGLVAVWVGHSGPVLVCDPRKGVAVLKGLRAGVSVEELQRLLRESGAVLREDAEPKRESVV